MNEHNGRLKDGRAVHMTIGTGKEKNKEIRYFPYKYENGEWN